MSTLGFVVEQAPQAMGYALYAIDQKDGKLDKRVVAFCTSMVEVSIIRGRLEKDAFGTEALPPREREVVYMAPPSIPQQHQPTNGFDPGQQNGYPHVPLSDRPAVLDKMEFPTSSTEDESTLGKITRAMKGRANAWAWFAVLTVSYLGMRMA